MTASNDDQTAASEATTKDMEALEAALPEDAPPGHEAHTQVKYENNRWPTAYFHMNEKKQRFQATLGMTGSMENAMRVCRACFVKFRNGTSVDELKQIRQEYYERLKFFRGGEKGEKGDKAGPDSAKRLRKSNSEASNFSAFVAKDGAASPSSTQAQTPKGSKRKEPDAKESAEGEARAPKEPEEASKDVKAAPPAALDEDHIMSLLPQDLSPVAAEHKVKFNSDTRLYQGFVWFEYKGGGSRERFQTTLLRSGGSRRAAEHIARLCIAKFEAGASRDEVAQFRAEMYALCPEAPEAPKSGNVAPAAAEKQKEKRPEKKQKGSADAKANKPGKAAVSGDVEEKLRAEGRLKGALRIEGRDEKRKNASINGVYALMKGGFEGKPAYEKVDGGVARVLFYSARKSRWKIHESLNDSAGGFAFAKSKDGKARPGPSLSWQVFEGKDSGYNEDSSVRCSLLTQDAGGKKAKRKGSDSGSDSDNSNAEKEGSTASNSAGFQSSGSSSSESGDESDAAKSKSKPAPTPAGTLKPLPPRAKPKHKVCAKMLCRSGLRSVTSFARRSEG